MQKHDSKIRETVYRRTYRSDSSLTATNSPGKVTDPVLLLTKYLPGTTTLALSTSDHFPVEGKKSGWLKSCKYMKFEGEQNASAKRMRTSHACCWEERERWDTKMWDFEKTMQNFRKEGERSPMYGLNHSCWENTFWTKSHAAPCRSSQGKTKIPFLRSLLLPVTRFTSTRLSVYAH